MKTDREYPQKLLEIESLFNMEPKDISKLLINSKSIILYDTNCFGFHAKKFNEKYYALDFFNKDDVVIFLEPIIREMNYKDTNEIQTWYLDYFRELKNKVRALIYIDERDYVDLLTIGKPSLNNIEIRLKNAFLNAFKDNAELRNEIKQLNIRDTNFYKDLINIANKDGNEKNRGEIAIFTAVQVLCSLKELTNYKIFSDDYVAYPYMSELTDILGNLSPKANIAYISTIRNIQELTRNFSLDYERVLEYLTSIKWYTESKIYFREIPYDTMRHVSKSNENLAKDLVDKKIEILF